MADCLRAVNAQLDDPPHALAIAPQGETVVPVSAGGEALAMAPISADARAGTETGAIAQAVGARRLQEITGQPPHPMFSVGKIAWTRRMPGVWSRAATFHCLGDFLARRLGVPPRSITRWPPGPWRSTATSAPGQSRSWTRPASRNGCCRVVPVGTELAGCRPACPPPWASRRAAGAAGRRARSGLRADRGGSHRAGPGRGLAGYQRMPHRDRAGMAGPAGRHRIPGLPAVGL